MELLARPRHRTKDRLGARDGVMLMAIRNLPPEEAKQLRGIIREISGRSPSDSTRHAASQAIGNGG
jgi:hypothetical protein